MSEPARSLPPLDASRPASGPLRDWLVAMKAQAAGPGPAQAAQPAARPEPAWSPRVVQPDAATMPEAAVEADEDVSEIMAENLMLKAKLRLEAERHDDLQAMLAQEIRDLRRHVEEEMADLAAIRAERDGLRSERDALVAARDAAREDADLWQARAEALAQPLFQRR